ncbi:helix-turn-helix transcriptional regulator [Paenibacillus sp.]|uniref:helix-turn-helix transcriptional regulator n=1 Tax=Paenibacillus sp. TaxID=58172 RepID=UPI002D255935|nr:helix-turn-helix transcriptional regulator [Paenibacillus sp.]HZG83812.1 helix-turn-helix transcriptional regulator [Paenibacillus sp.]
MALRLRSRLPEILDQTGKTQAALADYLNVTESYISQVINGKRQLSVMKLKLAARFLNCSMDDLIELIED